MSDKEFLNTLWACLLALGIWKWTGENIWKSTLAVLGFTVVIALNAQWGYLPTLVVVICAAGCWALVTAVVRAALEWGKRHTHKPETLQ